MKSLKLTLFIASAFVFIGAQAQTTKSGNWCGFDQAVQHQINQNPNFIQQFEALIQNGIKNNAKNKRPGPYIVPVVVHNITHDGGVGYVDKATIEGAIERLNIDFNRLNNDTTNTRALFKPYAGSMDIQFRLAHKDPNGDCTEGIVRLDHPSSTDFQDSDKSVSYWPSTQYFNIWLVDLINGSNPPSYIAGYAQFPTSGINSTYGVVVDNTFFGPNDRTLTHELGHCFGLYHTFQGGGSTCTGNCNNSGDRCCDTPPTPNSTQSCDLNQNNCQQLGSEGPYGTNVVDQIENYMSYDNCQNMFSDDQIARMQSSLDNIGGLINLVSGSNNTATGTANPYGPVICTPIADFSYNREMICEGSTVTFEDESYNATPTTWNWTFTGGTPATSSDSMPTITYNTAGVYSVTHEPGTTAGTDVISKNSIITVSSLTADYASPVVDGFENTTTFNNEWFIGTGADNVNWTNTNGAAATGSRSVRLMNFTTNSSASDVDYLVSPSYDLSSSTNKLMKFKIAYANREPGNTDRLFIKYSLNCGQSWTIKQPFGNAAIVTAPDHGSSFVPTAGEWLEKTVDFSAQGSATNLRVMFEFTSDGGNNIYLDDINIGGTVGIDEFDNIGNFLIYPNPTNANATISFSLIKKCRKPKHYYKKYGRTDRVSYYKWSII